MDNIWIAVIIAGAVLIDVFMLGLMDRGPLASLRRWRENRSENG